MSKSRQQGFTLIEAAVAIAVVAILSGIVVPLVVKNLNDARRARAANDVQVIAAAVASQLKDTASRPRVGAGAANANWVSGPGAGVGAPLLVTNFGYPNVATNTFVQLFNNTTANGNTLFGTATGAEFSYRGPYLGQDVSQKLDPWARRYFIVGYNANGNITNGSIYIVSAGPDGAVDANNVAYTVKAGQAVASAVANWDFATNVVSADDVVTRIN